MRFDRLDLNLLVALDTLIERCNVSLAANDLCLSQSAMSGALKRLREYFGDELLVQRGRTMLLTPKAKQLAKPVREALLYVRNHITTPARFDPATSERCFHIVCSDYSHQVILADVIGEISNVAPGVTFEIHTPDSYMIDMFHRGEIDLFVTANHPQVHIEPEHPNKDLFLDEEVAICWKDSDIQTPTFDIAKFSTLGHAVVNFGPHKSPSISEAIYEQRGIQRRIEITVPSFSSLPMSVIGTQKIATMHRRQAEFFARLLPIRILALPFEMPMIREIVYWHTMRGSDEGLRWLLSRVLDACEKLAPCVARNLVR